MSHTRRTSTTIDEARTLIAIHLERAVVDLRAAAIAIENLPAHKNQKEDLVILSVVSGHIAAVHNRYSHIKQS